MPSPDPYDFLGISSLLSDEEKLLRATVRRFTEEKILPEVGAWWEEGTYPKELAKEMGALGLLGMHLEGYGCAGTWPRPTVWHASSWRRATPAPDRSSRSRVLWRCFPIWKFGSEEQKQTWLPGMAAGDIIGCFGLTEPDSGSDPSSMRTSARKDGSDWIINGTKMWITNGNVADLAIVWARTDGGIRGFIVPTDTEGFTANLIHRKVSLRASITSELVLDNVRVPGDFVLPGVSSMRGPLVLSQ